MFRRAFPDGSPVSNQRTDPAQYALVARSMATEGRAEDETSANVSTLLSKALLQYTREWEAVDVALPNPPSLLFWSNFLRPVATAVRLSDVHRLARVSRRAIRPTLQQRQLFLIEPRRGGHGEQVVCLTEDGRSALNAGIARFEIVDGPRVACPLRRGRSRPVASGSRSVRRRAPARVAALPNRIRAGG